MPSTNATPAAACNETGLALVSDANRFRFAFVDDCTKDVIAIEFVATHNWSSWYSEQTVVYQTWLRSQNAEKSPGPGLKLIPSFEDATLGRLSKVIAPVDVSENPVWIVAAVMAAVPIGNDYKVVKAAGLSAYHIDLGWALGAYAFDIYKSKKNKTAHNQRYEHSPPNSKRLVRCTTGAERTLVDATCSSIYMARDIISMPAEDFGPAQLEATSRALAKACNADISVCCGDDLLSEGYPQVHVVGRAAEPGREPRVIEMVWNEGAERTVALVGKGVCYDTGGLSIKSSNGMLTMKKDLGGGAVVLSLAAMLMRMNVDVCVRVLVPAVENSVAASAFRPGDVLTARNGKTTENIDSDAEGRLILADCLAAAAELHPDLIIDCATLTGSQRVALGPHIPSVFVNRTDVSDDLCRTSIEQNDLVWPMPLYDGYRNWIKSHIADLKSCSKGSYAGSITAALYLEEFVDNTPWVHMDFMGYNVESLPGRPEGGEAMGMRALYHYLAQRFSKVQQ